MGIVYRVECPNCGYHTELPLGSGRGSINLMRNLRVLDAQEQKKIIVLNESGRIARYSVENKVTQCGACGILKEKTIITITDKTGQELVFGNRCSCCGKELQVWENEKEYNIRCPKCGEARLTFQPTGHWD